MAPEGQEFWERYESEGFMLLSAMVEANTGTPDTIDVADWADTFGLTHPVLVDASAETSPYVVYGFPTFVVIDSEMVIQNADMWPWDDAFITSLL